VGPQIDIRRITCCHCKGLPYFHSLSHRQKGLISPKFPFSPVPMFGSPNFRCFSWHLMFPVVVARRCIKPKIGILLVPATVITNSVPSLVASGQLTWKQPCLGLLDPGLVTDAFFLISPILPLSPLRIALPT
jgi:hypothetical protein